MKKIVPGLLLVFTMIVSACAMQRKVPPQGELSFVQMWRTSCFGRCPNYKLELYSDGLLRYTGISFTDTGIYEKNIGAAKAQAMLEEFSRYTIDTLQASYEVNISDLPGLNYIFRYGDKTKEVRNAEFGPAFLKEIATEMDRFVRSGSSERPHMDGSWKLISKDPKGD